MPQDNSTNNKTIGFVGLGEMGSGMAANIIKGGYPLVVFDINKEAVSQLQHLGATVAENFQTLAGTCDSIIFSLPNHVVVEKVLFGTEGLIQYLSSNHTIIDCGTTNPLATKDFYERFATKNISFIDAPVSGFPQRATEGTLTIMVGSASEDDFTNIESLLKCMGTLVVRMGESGTGQLAKVINNVFYNIACATVAELLPLSVKMGLNTDKMVEIVSNSTGQSVAMNYFGPMILERNFKTGYAMENAYKDMESVIDVMKTYKIPLPVTMAAVSTYQMALNQELGKENKGAMIKVWEKVLGVTVKKT